MSEKASLRSRGIVTLSSSIFIASRPDVLGQSRSTMPVTLHCTYRGIGVHEKHELDVAACDERVDVVVLEGVDFLEISAIA
jgi:hypothetical protein